VVGAGRLLVKPRAAKESKMSEQEKSMEQFSRAIAEASGFDMKKFDKTVAEIRDRQKKGKKR
jgi:hypothetical protein